MPTFNQAYYELAFKVRYMEARGDAFQDFFADVMERRYPGDYIRVAPWGRVGDLKNDGYLTSERKIFQCYAPWSMTDDAMIAKMERDFEGAVVHWRVHMSTWVFVTDDLRGLPAPITGKLLQLSARYEGVVAIVWGYETLRQVGMSLTEPELSELLGVPPSPNEVVNPRFAEIEPLLDDIAARWTDSGLLVPVPPNKLDANALSEPVRILLLAGMQGSQRVKAFFSQHYDPSRGDQVADAFHTEYVRLRDIGLPADDIFASLKLFATGRAPTSPRREAAALALLAYLFERCDIFEASVV